MTTENKNKNTNTNEQLNLNVLNAVGEEFVAFFNSDEYARCEEEASQTASVINAEKFACEIKLVEMVRRSKVLKKTKTSLIRGAIHDLSLELLALTDYIETLKNIVKG